MAEQKLTKYQRRIKGVVVDLYDIFDAYEITDQAVGHALKKLMMLGKRGHKDFDQDLDEAIWSLERATEIRDAKQPTKKKKERR